MPPRRRANERARSSLGVMVGSRGRSAPEFFRGRPGEHSVPLIPQPTPEPSGQSPGMCLHTSRSERPRLGEVAPLGKLTKYVETASKPTLPPFPCHRAGVSNKRAVGAPYRSCFASGQCLSAPLLWQMTMHRSVHTYQRRCRVPRRRAERPARPRGYAINDRAGLVFSETSDLPSNDKACSRARNEKSPCRYYPQI